MTLKRPPVIAIEFRDDSQPTMLRVGNGVVIGVIALSVLAQCIAFVIVWKGGAAAPVLTTVSEYLKMTILPGAALAFVKLILMVVRRDWRGAAAYLSILLLPFLAASVVAHESTSEAVNTEEPESEEYLAGRGWARANAPNRRDECQGSHEFNRGCRATVSAMWHEKFQVGREWALRNRPQRPSGCQGELNFVAGCQGYLLEQVDYFDRYKKSANTPPNDYVVVRPTTTEECVREVNAVFETHHALHRQSGFVQDDFRTWRAELHNCQGLDRSIADKLLSEGSGRLRRAVGQLKDGLSIAEDEKRQIAEDEVAITQLPDQSYRTSYLRLLHEYKERLSGQYREPVVEYPDLSCAEYQKKIDAMRTLDKQRSDRMRALESESEPSNAGAERAKLNQERIDMLWDWKLYTDGAKIRGCRSDSE
jgi:hypothetical protein